MGSSQKRRRSTVDRRTAPEQDQVRSVWISTEDLSLKFSCLRTCVSNLEKDLEKSSRSQAIESAHVCTKQNNRSLKEDE